MQPQAAPSLATNAPTVDDPICSIPTGNLWVSLPAIDKRDGSISSLNVLHDQSAGLLEAGGPSDSAPLLAVHLTIDAVPVHLAGLTWVRCGDWMPHAQADIGTGRIEIWYCTPPDERGLALRLRYHHQADRPVDLEFGWDAEWGTTSSIHLRSTELVTTMTGVDDAWTGSRVLTCSSGLPLLALGWQGGDRVVLALGSPAPVVRATRHATVHPGGQETADLYVAVAPDPDGASTTALHLRRRGFEDLWRSGIDWLAEHALPVSSIDPRVQLSQRINANLFFNYFFAQGNCLDSGRPVLLTSRSPHYYVSAALWSRDAYIWSFPSLLLVDPSRARTVLVSSMAAGRSRLADHALYINGTPLYPGFELDQAAAPILAVALYVDSTGDRSILREEPVYDYLSRFPGQIEPWRHPTRELYRTFLLPTDDPTDHPYTTTGNALVAAAFDALAELHLPAHPVGVGREPDRSPDFDAEHLRGQATAIRAAIRDVLIVEGPDGPMWAWACDEDANPQLADEPPLSLRTLPFWGMGFRR